MFRPLYETQEDLNNESSVVKRIASYTRSDLFKIPIKYGADYIAFRKEIVASFIEIKCRTCTKETYTTYMISLHKIMTALDYAEALNVPFVVFVRWSDCIGYVEINRILVSLAEVAMGTNDTRNDPNDKEPCLFIPITSFKII
jgi:hypothetical protein